MGVAWGHSVSSLVRGYSLVRGFAYRGSTVDTNFPEIGPFGFNFSVWTKIRPFGSLVITDGVLADAILIPPGPPIKRR